MKFLLLIVYITMSASGMMLMKLGTAGTSFALEGGILSATVNPKLILGLCMYVVSFLLYIVVLSRFNLSFIQPVAGGIIMALAVVLGVLVLKERLTACNIAGIVLILAGVVVMNWKPQ